MLGKFIHQVGLVMTRSHIINMAESKNMSVLVKRLNPVSGKDGWVLQDDNYDFHQEIARSAFADMLHDSERNDKYYAAIKVAIEQTHQKGKKAHVLDIGTGTGLLAMMAARCGADTIHACEAFSPISKCAEEVIHDNGLEDRITVVHKRSTDMTVGEEGDLPRRANILVTEVFDTELIGEGAIETFNHAHQHLLEKDCLVVPSRGTVYAQVVESEWMQRWHNLTPWGALVPSQSIQRCPGTAAVHDLQLSELSNNHFRAITLPEPVFRFDWTGMTPKKEHSTVTTKAVASGTAQVIFMWWSLDMDSEGKIVLSCAPWWGHPTLPPGPEDIPWRDHWMQAAYYIPTPVPVQKGKSLQLQCTHDEFSLWFNITSNNNAPLFDILTKVQTFSSEPSSKLPVRPICHCMLHVTCSRTRLGMLNDPSRREKYFKVLKKLVTPTSVVLSFGDTSLLGLLAATLGASKVYHVEENKQSRAVIKELIQENNIENKVNLLDSTNFDEEIASSVNLVVGEPFFLHTVYPWDVLYRWRLRRQCPNATAMPKSFSIHAMPMQFKHLHKIRARLGTINGFKMTAFDNLIKGSSSVSDNDMECHPLWEYPGISLSHPRELVSFDSLESNQAYGNIPFNCTGIWHGMAVWVDVHLDSETTVSTGPLETPIPGCRVSWDPYCRQGVYFMLSPLYVTPKDFLQYTVSFKEVSPYTASGIVKDEEEIEFSFKLQKSSN